MTLFDPLHRADSTYLQRPDATIRGVPACQHAASRRANAASSRYDAVPHPLSATSRTNTPAVVQLPFFPRTSAINDMLIRCAGCYSKHAPRPAFRRAHRGALPLTVAAFAPSTSNPAFTSGSFQQSMFQSRRGGRSEDLMTVQGAVQKTAFLLALTMATAAYSWLQARYLATFHATLQFQPLASTHTCPHCTARPPPSATPHPANGPHVLVLG